MYDQCSVQYKLCSFDLMELVKNPSLLCRHINEVHNKIMVSMSARGVGWVHFHFGSYLSQMLMDFASIWVILKLI